MSDDYPEVRLDGDLPVLRVQKFGLRVRMSEEMIRGPKERGWVLDVTGERFGWSYALWRTADARFADEARNDTWVLVADGRTLTKRGALRKMRKVKQEFERSHR